MGSNSRISDASAMSAMTCYSQISTIAIESTVDHGSEDTNNVDNLTYDLAHLTTTGKTDPLEETDEKKFLHNKQTNGSLGLDNGLLEVSRAFRMGFDMFKLLENGGLKIQKLSPEVHDTINWFKPKAVRDKTQLFVHIARRAVVINNEECDEDNELCERFETNYCI